MIDVGHPRNDELRQFHLHFSGHREGAAESHALLNGLGNLWIRMPEDQRGVVVEEIDPLLSFYVSHAATLAPADVDGIGREHGGMARVAARHYLGGPIVKPS